MQRPRNAKIFDFMSEREAIKREVTDRVVQHLRHQAHLTEDKALEYVLNEAAYLEMQRLGKRRSKLDMRPYDFWHQLARRVGKATQAEKAQVLRELVSEYSEDVAGKFTPQVYYFATRLLPVGLSVLFNAQNLDNLVRNFQQLGDRIIIEGHVEHLKKLTDQGTLIIVPTHSSNLDSVVVGFALEEAGLPPATYGAGKNLFTNKLLSFFMHNLGAYRVDRRLRHSIYKQVLKTYSQVLLERGYHQLFFPGGTRARSNQVDSHLKLGLLGTALSAYTQNLLKGRDKPKMFVCPLTINYHLVLEAETLISDYLRTDGGARFIIENDEFSDFRKVTQFAMKTMAMNYTMVLRFGEPLDPFGNFVDEDGESLDPHGRRIDTERYLWVDGKVREDARRDRIYTKECGQAVAESFQRNTVVLSTSFLSFVMFHYLRELYPDLDLYRLLRLSKGEPIPFDAIYHRADQLRKALVDLAADNKITLGREVAQLPIPELIDRGAKALSTYHATPVVRQRTNCIEVGHPNLLYFYSRRLAGYGLKPYLATSEHSPATEMEADQP